MRVSSSRAQNEISSFWERMIDLSLCLEMLLILLVNINLLVLLLAIKPAILLIVLGSILLSVFHIQTCVLLCFG